MNSRLKRLFTVMLVTLSLVSLAMPAAAATNGVRGDRVIRTALTYLGTPYRFGANGPAAFDCSSFVRHVLNQAAGIRMPRTAAAQSTVGRRIAKTQLQPGDLVFFKNTYKAGVSHVGFAMGSGRMLHAWPRGGVRIDRLSQRYYVEKYHSSRTVLR